MRKYLRTFVIIFVALLCIGCSDFTMIVTYEDGETTYHSFSEKYYCFRELQFLSELPRTKTNISHARCKKGTRESVMDDNLEGFKG